MPHYDDLIERLRKGTKLPTLQSLCNEAADAIEALVGAENAKTVKDAPLTDYISREAFLEEKRKLYCENCKRRYGLKKGKSVVCYEIGDAPCRSCGIGDVLDDVEDFPAADVVPVPEGGIGEMSDGYHTFNGLYYQRMVLFAALVKAYKDKAWKSWKHEDGELCFGGGWFIVGIDTPEGSYTYHYEAKDWDMFACAELPVAKHWDGHTEEDVTRLLTLDVRLDAEERQRWIPVTEALPECDLGAEVGNIEWISCGMVHAGCFGRGGKYRDAYFRTWTDAGEGMDAKDAEYWRAVTLPDPPKEDNTDG